MVNMQFVSFADKGGAEGTKTACFPFLRGAQVPPAPPSPKVVEQTLLLHFRYSQLFMHAAKAPVPSCLQWIVTRRSEAFEGPIVLQEPPNK